MLAIPIGKQPKASPADVLTTDSEMTERTRSTASSAASSQEMFSTSEVYHDVQGRITTVVFNNQSRATSRAVHCSATIFLVDSSKKKTLQVYAGILGMIPRPGDMF